jgi:antitoxin component of MazEF toxin-antitoxin module
MVLKGTAKLRKIGTSKGIIILKNVLDELNFEEGDLLIYYTNEKGELVVKKG